MLANFQAWLAKPFSTDQDVLHWFLFFGLLIVISITWGLILRTLDVGGT